MTLVTNARQQQAPAELNHRWTSVSTSLANSGLDVDANSTVTSLTVGHTTPVSIASGITLSGGIAVTAGSIKSRMRQVRLAPTVSMSGGTLDADETLTVSQEH